VVKEVGNFINIEEHIHLPFAEYFIGVSILFNVEQLIKGFWY
jgi:hypothetical protein